MRIAICVKEVPDPTAAKRIDEGTMRLVRSGENTLNPYDRHAIEAAVQIKEGPAPDTEITIVTVGPESAGRSVDRALAQGGDQSVHVADEAAAGSDLLGTARILAAALTAMMPMRAQMIPGIALLIAAPVLYYIMFKGKAAAPSAS